MVGVPLIFLIFLLFRVIELDALCLFPKGVTHNVAGLQSIRVVLARVRGNIYFPILPRENQGSQRA
mgnify:CR=1 FL=1